MKPILVGSFFSAVAATLACATVQAQSVEQFYKGKTIEILIGASTGGGYDINARLVGRHMGKHLPGSPSFLPKNVPGGGSLRAANMLYNAAKRDGTVLGVVSRSVMTMPLMGVEAAKFDPTDLTWIGSVANEDSLCFAWHAAAVKQWSDLFVNRLIVGAATGPGGATYDYPVMLRNIFGARFDLVTGYPGGKEVLLAMERGEIEGSCGTYSSLKFDRADWIRDRKINPIVLISLEKNPELPNVPTVFDLARSEDEKGIFKIILAPQVAGRPMLAPPAIPGDRKVALRRAFDRTMKDADFIAEATKLSLEVTPVSGEEIEALIKEVYGSSVALVEKAKGALESQASLITVETKLNQVGSNGETLVIDVKGEPQQVSVGDGGTEVKIAGNPAKRIDLKPGMSCRVTYKEHGSEATQVYCR